MCVEAIKKFGDSEGEQQPGTWKAIQVLGYGHFGKHRLSGMSAWGWYTIQDL